MIAPQLITLKKQAIYIIMVFTVYVILFWLSISFYDIIYSSSEYERTGKL